MSRKVRPFVAFAAVGVLAFGTSAKAQYPRMQPVYVGPAPVYAPPPPPPYPAPVYAPPAYQTQWTMPNGAPVGWQGLPPSSAQPWWSGQGQPNYYQQYSQTVGGRAGTTTEYTAPGGATVKQWKPW